MLSNGLSIVEGYWPLETSRPIISLARNITSWPLIGFESTVNGIVGVGAKLFKKNLLPTNAPLYQGITEGPSLTTLPGVKKHIGGILTKLGKYLQSKS